MKDRLLVVGSFVQDLTYRVSRFPVPGQTMVGRFVTGPGGKGSNQAVAAARAGAGVFFVGAVGDDPFGEAARRFYGEEGIEAAFVVKEGRATGTAAIFVDDEGQNEIVVDIGANRDLEPGDIPAGPLARAGAVVGQLESAFDATAHLFRTARGNGAATVLNPAPMPASGFPDELLGLADHFIPNETEFCQLAGGSLAPADLRAMAPEALHGKCRKLGPPVVIVTLGDAGAFVSTREGWERIPVVPGIQAVDSTGAGDAFVGGFAAGLLRFGGDVGRAVRFGSVVAALSVTRFGTAPAMPRLDEILPLYEKTWAER